MRKQFGPICKQELNSVTFLVLIGCWGLPHMPLLYRGSVLLIPIARLDLLMNRPPNSHHQHHSVLIKKSNPGSLEKKVLLPTTPKMYLYNLLQFPAQINTRGSKMPIFIHFNINYGYRGRLSIKKDLKILYPNKMLLPQHMICKRIHFDACIK